MKKFSVLLVAILALMMLFVSCENEPEKRAATKEDGEIINGLIIAHVINKIYLTLLSYQSRSSIASSTPSA